MRFLILFLSFLYAAGAQVTPTAVIAELNYARQNPQAYANLIQQWAPYFRGRFLILPGRTAVMTNTKAFPPSGRRYGPSAPPSRWAR
jgi:hypothetical protein